ncbi:MAG: hypothetical protein GX539_15620 [Candidatus Cloacimonetes bacterium]|jgi:hypothetical protein|nr:hypothetical protein [Candidatus Cloacimonadota bacterium]
MASTSRRTALLILGAAAAFACGDRAPGEPLGLAPDVATAEQESDSQAALAATSRLVVCPSSEARSVSKTVGILGGTIELDGTRVIIPVGAVLLPTTITLTLPASQYMEVDLTANALDHFEFPLPVHVTIDYSRCNDSALSDRPVSAWYIDSLTKSLLELMTGRDDRAARRISFTTIHFSGYSIAQ